MEEKDVIKLYPGHWFYNASVLGFLNLLYKDVLTEEEKMNFEKEHFKANYVILKKDYFRRFAEFIETQKNREVAEYYKDNGIIIRYKNDYFLNYISNNPADEGVFLEYIKSFEHLEKTLTCDICGRGYYIEEKVFDNMIKKNPEAFEKFVSRVSKFEVSFDNMLASSSNEFPNSFYNKTTLKTCHLCSFLTIHKYTIFIKLPDGTKIFVNSPSFKVMWYLNRFAKSAFEEENNKSKPREILAMGIIEYTLKLKETLGIWTGMNIEIVMMYQDRSISFYSLPYETVKILNNYEISSLLSTINERTVLEYIIRGEYSKILDLAYAILSALSTDKLDNNKYLNSLIKNSRNKGKYNMLNLANNLLKLFSLLKEIEKTFHKGGIYVKN